MANVAATELMADGFVESKFVAPSGLLLKASMGVAAVGGVLALDLGSQFAFWRKYSTEIIPDSRYMGVDSNRRWLGFGGLGRSDALFLSNELGKDLPGAIDAMSYSHLGISGKRVGRAMSNYYLQHYPIDTEPQFRQNAAVHSMGFLAYLMGIKWCLDNDIYVPPIDTLMAFSSPLYAEHTHREKFIRTANKYPYPGGAISKMCIEFYQRQEQEKLTLAALGRSAYGALQCSHTECSPALWSSQVRTIAGTGPYAENAFEGVITPETRVMHFGDEGDRTTNIPLARIGIADFLRPYGAQLTIVDTPGLGHANVPGVRDLIPRLLSEAAR